VDPWNAIWIFLILSSLQPLVQKQLLALARRRALAAIAETRDATVITLIVDAEAGRAHFDVERGRGSEPDEVTGQETEREPTGAGARQS
jgi:hypothetical protein